MVVARERDKAIQHYTQAKEERDRLRVD